MADHIEDARTAARVWATAYWAALQPTLPTSTFTNKVSFAAMLATAATAVNAELALHNRWDPNANAAFVDAANAYISTESVRVKNAYTNGNWH
ncbi:hypothetical protein ABIA00_006197 [Bradyrhizobium ottawaense]|uniref:hypothetical protein n=1 Tax=Bradyrhizobium ottawaense TaxID=931866 RepID=UPI003838E01F